MPVLAEINSGLILVAKLCSSTSPSPPGSVASSYGLTPDSRPHFDSSQGTQSAIPALHLPPTYVRLGPLSRGPRRQCRPNTIKVPQLQRKPQRDERVSKSQPTHPKQYLISVRYISLHGNKSFPDRWTKKKSIFQSDSWSPL